MKINLGLRSFIRLDDMYYRMARKDRRFEIYLLQFLNELLKFADRPEVRPLLQRYVANYIWEHFVKPKELCEGCQYPLLNVKVCPCCGSIYDNEQMLLKTSPGWV